MASQEMIFEYIFANLAFWLPWRPIKFISLDKNDTFNGGVLKEQLCKTFVKISVMR